MRRALLLPLLLAGCSNLEPLTANIRVANNSVYDFSYARIDVCSDPDGLICEAPSEFELVAGQWFAIENLFAGEGVYGETDVYIAAAAVDVEADGYLWRGGDLVGFVNAPVMDIEIEFTLADCCHDFSQ